MQAKSILLAAALLASPAAVFAQSSATMPASPPASTSPDATAQPDATQPAAPSDAPPPAAAPAGAPVPATPADLKPNVSVFDVTGAPVGTIESVTSAGAVVTTGKARAQIPAASFNKNAQGLVIGMTKVQLEAAVAKATPPKS